jgi:hypothetical protein
LALDNNAISVLEKGLGFDLAPKKIPKDDFICNIEAGIKNLPENMAEEVRHEVALALRSRKKFKE